MKGCEVYFLATFSWTSTLSDRKVPSVLYSDAEPLGKSSPSLKRGFQGRDVVCNRSNWRKPRIFLAKGSVLVKFATGSTCHYDRFLKDMLHVGFSCSNHYFPLLSHFYLSLFHVISKVLIQWKGKWDAKLKLFLNFLNLSVSNTVRRAQ